MLEIVGIVDLDAALGGRTGTPGGGAVATRIKKSAQTYERAGFDAISFRSPVFHFDPVVLTAGAAFVTEKLGFVVSLEEHRLTPETLNPVLTTLNHVAKGRIACIVPADLELHDSEVPVWRPDPGPGSVGDGPILLGAAPLADTAARIDALGRGAGRRFGLTIRVILGATESYAWDRAMGILKRLETLGGPLAQAGSAPRKEVYDDRFWTGLYDVTDSGERAAVVGTPEQVADTLGKYAGLGISSFFIQGFHPFSDAEEHGRDLLPLLREIKSG